AESRAFSRTRRGPGCDSSRPRARPPSGERPSPPGRRSRAAGAAAAAAADRAEVVAVGGELVLLPPCAQADVDAAAADHVDTCADLREVGGVPVQRAGDELPETDPPGRLGE